MAQPVTVSTVEYPPWWGTAVSVKVTTRGGVAYSGATASTEFLPQGVSMDTGQFLLVIPWENIDNLLKVS